MLIKSAAQSSYNDNRHGEFINFRFRHIAQVLSTTRPSDGSVDVAGDVNHGAVGVGDIGRLDFLLSLFLRFVFSLLLPRRFWLDRLSFPLLRGYTSRVVGSGSRIRVAYSLRPCPSVCL